MLLKSRITKILEQVNKGGKNNEYTIRTLYLIEAAALTETRRVKQAWVILSPVNFGSHDSIVV